MLPNIPVAAFRRPAIISGGLAVLWLAVAFIRAGATSHLVPALVAAVFPVGDPPARRGVSAKRVLS